MLHTFSNKMSGRSTLLRRFSHDNRGVAAVEFAMILPILLTMYLGMVELTHGVQINRKVTLLSRTLADLTAQAATMPDAEINSIFEAAKFVLQPERSEGVRMVIVSIYIGADKKPKVCWGDQRGGMAIPTEVALDEGLLIENTSVIMATAELPYNPAASLISTAYTLSQTAYMRPRLVTQVTRVKAGGDVVCPTT